jgi:3-hydroxyacyl-[acyl-carrier-protein] dehydratase
MTDCRGPCGFILLDQLVELRPGRDVVAAACFHADDPVFADHFPGRPIVPGVLLTEAMGQAAGWLLVATFGFARWPLLVMIDKAKFRRLVRPGDRLTIAARLRSTGADNFEADADIHVGDARVADARLVFHAFEFESDEPDDHRQLDWARATFARLGGARLLAEPSAGGPC